MLSVLVEVVEVVGFVVEDVVVGVVVVLVGVVVVELVVELVVVEVVEGTVVVVVESPPPPARAITAITRPMTSAATRPMATFWPVLMPPESS